MSTKRERMEAKRAADPKKWEKWTPEPRARAKVSGVDLTYEAVIVLDRLNQDDVIETGLHEKDEAVDTGEGKKNRPGIYSVLKDSGLRMTIEALEELNRAGYIQNPPDAALAGRVNVRKWRLSPAGIAVAKSASKWVAENNAKIAEAAERLIASANA